MLTTAFFSQVITYDKRTDIVAITMALRPDHGALHSGRYVSRAEERPAFPQSLHVLPQQSLDVLGSDGA